MVTVSVGFSGYSSASGKNVHIHFSVQSGSGTTTSFTSSTGSFQISSGSNYTITFPRRFVDSGNNIWTSGSLVTGSAFTGSATFSGGNTVTYTSMGAAAGSFCIQYTVLQSPWGGDSLTRDNDASTEYDAPDSELVFASGARDGSAIVRHAVSPPPA